MSTVTHNELLFQTNLDDFNTLVNVGFILHGHVCPAMPLGLRASLEAMNRLGIERAKNKELHVIMENGPAHAALCFSEGVQVGTSATFGKGEIIRTNEGKNAFTLIDYQSGNSVRVNIKYEFFLKMMNSEFVKKRKEGIEPYEIDLQLPKNMIQNMLNTPAENIFEFSSIKNINFRKPKGTFNFDQCTKCKEPIYESGIRIKNNKIVCLTCSNL